MNGLVSFGLLAVFMTAFGDYCPPDVSFTDVVCEADFAGKVTVTGSGTIDGGDFYFIDISQPDVVKGSRNIRRAYRTLQYGFVISNVQDAYLTYGQTYFLTGKDYSSTDPHSIHYNGLCELVIEYSQFESDEQYAGLRNFTENYRQLCSTICQTPCQN